MTGLPMPEAEPLVQCDRPRVVGSGMKERRFAAFKDAAHDGPYQRGGIAFAQVIRVSADGAHLGIAVHLQTLAGHCDEPAADADAEEASELVCARAERARLGQGGEFEHVSRILHTELYDWGGRIFWPQVR